ncbi:COX15/CtaA family protein [Pararhizobium mangrovi]|nr:COX15/CtaA family protein [Pararhizobium mangrovi]
MDVRTGGSRIAGEIDRVGRDRRRLRAWLAIVVLAIGALVIVGGATRLTHSGLSMTKWHPIHGVVPPLNQAEWQEEFAGYKQIPEYRELNPDMTLAGFKGIFWWEWSHRLLARSVGILFAVPLAFFWLSGRLESRLKAPLVGIFLLGGLQGFIGWWMVSSGLADRTDVSQYRLATHLTLACIILAAIAWVYAGLSAKPRDEAAPNWLVWLAGLVALDVFLQIYLGGLVSGLDAGFSYNTWPLMDGAIVPHDLFTMEPVWRNFFENPKCVQFLHRTNAYLLWTLIAVQMIVTLATVPRARHANRAMVLFVLVTVQAVFGITTLLLEVPIDWALLHQGGAIVVLLAAVMHCRGLVGTCPRPGEDAIGEGQGRLSRPA